MESSTVHVFHINLRLTGNTTDVLAVTVGLSTAEGCSHISQVVNGITKWQSLNCIYKEIPNFTAEQKLPIMRVAAPDVDRYLVLVAERFCLQH